TQERPKPLLPLRGQALIDFPLQALAAAGVREVVVNLGYRGEQIRRHLGDGSRDGVRIAYSEEGDPPLETGGGIFHALPLLGGGTFIVVNADVYTDYPMAQLVRRARELPAAVLAHLVLVPNPPQHPRGDFALQDGRVANGGSQCHTFSGLSVHRPELFAGCKPGRFPMLPLWRAAAERGQLTGELFEGTWSDVGTPERLEQLERQMPPSAPRSS
ncbi:MAG TPA: nucleotidyltransferase family protein, partial [Candidatus Binatia bacterium]|nr:nucleotidyltransferase family protein [Candidatus Binatia bacterium]